MFKPDLLSDCSSDLASDDPVFLFSYDYFSACSRFNDSFMKMVKMSPATNILRVKISPLKVPLLVSPSTKMLIMAPK